MEGHNLGLVGQVDRLRAKTQGRGGLGSQMAGEAGRSRQQKPEVWWGLCGWGDECTGRRLSSQGRQSCGNIQDTKMSPVTV